MECTFDHEQSNAIEVLRSEEKPVKRNNNLRVKIKLLTPVKHEANESTNYSITNEQIKEGRDPIILREKEASSKESPTFEAKEIDNMHPCKLCPKSFHSVKALHGHMRTHPKEEMKEKEKNEEEFTATFKKIRSNPHIPWYEILKWKSKEERTLRKQYPPGPITDPEVFEGAKDLMCLYNEGKESNTEIKSQVEDKIDKQVGQDPDVEITAKLSVDTNQDDDNNNEPVAKKIKLVESSKGAYVCGTCSKSFTCHQALGGHATSHSKDKNKKGEGDDDGLKGDRKKSGDEKKHVCEICSASFTTGQALGGHKRAHYDTDKLKKTKKEVDQVQNVSEDTDGDLVELPLAIAMEGAGQAQTVTEDIGQILSEFPFLNAVEEANQVRAGNEENGRVFGEPRSAGNHTGLPFVFYLNQPAIWEGEMMYSRV
ncbi:uncharacterized protein A4U43_C10F1980 [Asparagus officinalis]|uniref:C2H2-type domain-containing protein n=1 Tax=Asparagus officinalis TaxID=4686 RepID=A0A5P1E305_ASPOF|nr:uncharacterized protein LOC109825875 [Asparagus officinalis]XP_020251036.1 uncharacterized protein LOC109828453 [Asparagus officinalis]XP_020251037.1 uncharacterized protein LOC109828454 [Asparagus officinalis]ONK55887.1 uncharacterized protein A4U43_C10F1980 [Asparagus officinalis]